MIKKLVLTLVLTMFMMFPAASVFADAPQLDAAAKTQQDQAQQTRLENSLKKNPLVKDIQTIVNVMSAGVGVVITAMIILGGVQYLIAGDNSSALTAAKKRITNALIALVAFMFIFAFVQWLVPGGVF